MASHYTAFLQSESISRFWTYKDPSRTSSRPRIVMKQPHRPTGRSPPPPPPPGLNLPTDKQDKHGPVPTFYALAVLPPPHQRLHPSAESCNSGSLVTVGLDSESKGSESLSSGDGTRGSGRSVSCGSSSMKTNDGVEVVERKPTVAPRRPPGATVPPSLAVPDILVTNWDIRNGHTARLREPLVQSPPIPTQDPLTLCVPGSDTYTLPHLLQQRNVVNQVSCFGVVRTRRRQNPDRCMQKQRACFWGRRDVRGRCSCRGRAVDLEHALPTIVEMVKAEEQGDDADSNDSESSQSCVEQEARESGFGYTKATLPIVGTRSLQQGHGEGASGARHARTKSKSGGGLDAETEMLLNRGELRLAELQQRVIGGLGLFCGLDEDAGLDFDSGESDTEPENELELGIKPDSQAKVTNESSTSLPNEPKV